MPRKPRKPTARDYAIAQGLRSGLSRTAAVRAAGYSPSYAKCFGAKVAERMAVKQALLEIGEGLKPGQLGNMGKALLQKDLISPPREIRGRMAVVRTALEVDGMIGAPNQLHLHEHGEINPKGMCLQAKQMLAERMMEIMLQKNPDASPEKIAEAIESGLGISISNLGLKVIDVSPAQPPDPLPDSPSTGS